MVFSDEQIRAREQVQARRARTFLTAVAAVVLLLFVVTSVLAYPISTKYSSAKEEYLKATALLDRRAELAKALAMQLQQAQVINDSVTQVATTAPPKAYTLSELTTAAVSSYSKQQVAYSSEVLTMLDSTKDLPPALPQAADILQLAEQTRTAESQAQQQCNTYNKEAYLYNQSASGFLRSTMRSVAGYPLLEYFQTG